MSTKLFILLGKTFSGKSTFANKLIQPTALQTPNLTRVLEHTDRPKRPDDTNDVSYIFNKKPNEKTTLALRSYQVANGETWRYWFDYNDITKNTNNTNKLVVTDLLAATKLIHDNDRGLFYPAQLEIELLYLDTPLATIIHRINTSERSGENIKETLRRLDDDNQRYSAFDNHTASISNIPIHYITNNNPAGIAPLLGA